MAKDFWIDQSDPPYPAIRHRSDLGFEPEYTEVMSFAEARKQLKIICREHRQYWLAVMNYQLQQTAEDIIREAVEARRTE